MKYFETDMDGWDAKYNFVDENNVVLGYDATQDCCEQFGWYVSALIQDDKIPDSLTDPKLPPDGTWEGWTFDSTYFKELLFDECEDENHAVFRIVKGESEAFIVLFNYHNGYYRRYQICKY